MFDPDSDSFHGARHTPWRLLIRARFASEVDAIVASTVIRSLEPVVSTEALRTLVAAGVREAGKDRAEATAEMRLSAIAFLDEYGGQCGTLWPHWWWPPHRRDIFTDLGDPIAPVIINAALELVRAVGTDALKETFGSALEQVAQVQR